MSLSNGQSSFEDITEVLRSVRGKGAHLWTRDGQLHYKAPKGALTPDEIQILRASKDRIIRLLDRSLSAQAFEPVLIPRARADLAPLTHAQRAHWNLYGLDRQPSYCPVQSATRLRGRLNLDCLRICLAAMVQRHEALRSRIVLCDGTPMQEIASSATCPLETRDLQGLSEAGRHVYIQQTIENINFEPIDVTRMPAIRAWLLKLEEEDHVLLLAIEHIFSDHFSMNILLRDLFAAYAQTLQGQPLCLPDISMQLADHATWQQSVHGAWLGKHQAFWRQRIDSYGRSRFPPSEKLQVRSNAGWGFAPVRLGMELKTGLTDWCRQQRTTLVMGAFTVYAALALRWCQASSAIFLYETDGRNSPRIEHTIGYFASSLYLCIELRDSDTFTDLLERIIEEYCRAYEHADASYLEAQTPRPLFTHNTCFNCVAHSPRIDLDDMEQSALECSTYPVDANVRNVLERDTEPYMALIERGQEIVGGVQFPANRFTLADMEQLGRHFVVFVESLVRSPQTRIKELNLL